MWKTIIKICIYAILVGLIAVLSVSVAKDRKHIKSLNYQVKEQSAIIDSLLNRQSVVFDVSLNVQDKTRLTVNGKGNSGTINVPQEKVYVLEIDSTNISLRQ
ncbi:MAG: hypothetical protein J6S85_18505 [Methanobrevibacter sp.]|nr:hypothetical protein [Methanobrevibacter sp.]